MKQQPWIGNKWTDIIFVLLPPFFSLAFIIAFPSLFQNQDGMSDAWWVALILLVDVAHVYSTLYKTYFDKQAFAQHKNKLLFIPFVTFVAGVLLYSFSAMLFWRILAYAAVYHFIRQQYGFMRIYARKETCTNLFRTIDTVTIYTATIYPILFWHISGDRNFNWFVKGDFVQFANISSIILRSSSILYILILSIYVIKEIVFSQQSRAFNFPKNLVIAGTVFSWYFGIVYFNGDMAFTLLNVVSHGIPYMALIWMYGKQRFSKPNSDSDSNLMRMAFSKYGLVLFLGIIFLLAYAEEGLWDITLWKEHSNIFGLFHWGDSKLNDTLLTLLVPLLAVPQVTHYVIDGFIWRIKKNDLKWSDQHDA